MKLKRYKQARHTLKFYIRNFGLREPYQILVDGTFCQAAMKGKIQLKEQFAKYLGGEVKLVTTNCVIQELLLLGKEMKELKGGAVFIAKRLQLRACGHGRKGMPAPRCIASLIGKDNDHHYLVASQDPELRRELRAVPGVPLFHIIRNTMVLEKPTTSSEVKVQELVASRIEPSAHSKSILEKLDEQAGIKPKEEKKHKKKKGAKGPNPLSVKKSSKKRDTPTNSGGITKSKKRRQRLRIRQAMESLSLATEALSLGSSKSSASTANSDTFSLYTPKTSSSATLAVKFSSKSPLQQE